MASSSNRFDLKLLPGTSYNFYIEWGDGDADIFNQVTSTVESAAVLSHTYATQGTYQIAITEVVPGGFPGVYFNESGGLFGTTTDAEKITEINQWGDPGWNSSAEYAFAGCTALKKIADDGDTSFLGNVISLQSAWQGCTSLKEFPSLDTRNVTNFKQAWSDCAALTSFELLSTDSGIDFSRAWFRCSSLKSFPEINTSLTTNVDYTWSHCSSLTDFPELVLTGVSAFNNTWADCSSLTAFPLIDFSNAASVLDSCWYNCNSLKTFPQIVIPGIIALNSTWQNCSSLKEFPAIDTSSVQGFNSAWSGCTSLTSFPPIDTSAGTTFLNAWKDCTALIEFPVLDLRNLDDGIGCFENVTLPTSVYSNILIGLSANNTTEDVTFNGGNSKYNFQGQAARNYLTDVMDWTITDGGPSTVWDDTDKWTDEAKWLE